MLFITWKFFLDLKNEEDLRNSNMDNQFQTIFFFFKLSIIKFLIGVLVFVSAIWCNVLCKITFCCGDSIGSMINSLGIWWNQHLIWLGIWYNSCMQLRILWTWTVVITWVPVSSIGKLSCDQITNLVSNSDIDWCLGFSNHPVSGCRFQI